MLFGGIDSLRNNFSLYETFVSKNGRGIGNTLYLMFTYALIPAVCEEMTYRSILTSEYEGRGVICAVCVSSILFGILHLNARMLPVYIFAGFLLALTMYATRSVLCSIAVHFLYNLFCIFSQPLVTTFYRSTSSAGLFVVLVIILFMLSAAIFCFSASRLYEKYAKANKVPPYPAGLTATETLQGVLTTVCDIPTVLCLILFIFTVFFKQ
jgi:membrane protease YdiL (CAAX protease family)